MNDFGDLMRMLSSAIPLDLIISMINEETDAYLHATTSDDKLILLNKIELLSTIIITKSIEDTESEKKSEDDIVDNVNDADDMDSQLDAMLAELKKRKPE
jgi:GTPase involved in cell partitioning and DNA repair